MCGVHGGAGVLHVIGIYVILGIGCDDLFILLDAFNQSAWDSPPETRRSILLRMRWAYSAPPPRRRRAAPPPPPPPPLPARAAAQRARGTPARRARGTPRRAARAQAAPSGPSA